MNTLAVFISWATITRVASAKSIGISEYHPTDKDNEAIIYRADQAMYYAKEHGRNQIIIYERVMD